MAPWIQVTWAVMLLFVFSLSEVRGSTRLRPDINTNEEHRRSIVSARKSQPSDGQSTSSETSSSVTHHRQKRFWGWAAAVVTVAVICWLFCGDSDSDPPKYDPPSISCVKIAAQHEAPEGSNTAVVSWSEPTVTKGSEGLVGDPVKSPVSYVSGAAYTEGNHAVRYTVQDTKGASVSCDIPFSVIVRKCSWPHSTEHGYADSCDANPPYYGSTCTYTCNPGYSLATGSNLLTCLASGDFQGSISCNRNTCSVDDRHVISHATESCPNDHCVDPPQYGCRCFYSCEEGYEEKEIVPVDCASNGMWTQGQGECIDIIPPVIVCPGHISILADSNTDSASVNYALPTATDNSGLPPTVTLVSGGSPGSVFSGTTHVMFEARDVTGNTATCTFSVTVEVMTCVPIELSRYLVADCPEKLWLGASCAFSCMNGLAMNGSSSSTCVLGSGTGEWDLGGGYMPYCIYSSCPDIPPPMMGAVGYDSWDHGRVALLFCPENYGLPSGDDGEYVCGTSGWIGYDLTGIPECLENFLPGLYKMGSELQYFTGDCSDPQVQQQLKENFIDRMGEAGYCADTGCAIDDVRIECGPTQRRKKRDTHTHKITVLFDFVVTLPKTDGKIPVQALLSVFNAVNDIAAAVENDVTQGINPILTVAGLDTELDTASFQTQPGTADCPPGRTMAVTANGVECNGCSAGSYMNTSSNECVDCPVGGYQDENAQTECKSCPEHSETCHVRSKSSDNCIETCSAGYFSANGFVPCAACPSNSYQSNWKSLGCEPCPEGTVSGSASVECYDYDIRISDELLRLSDVQQLTNGGEISVSLWFADLREDTNSSQAILTLQSDTVTLELAAGAEASVRVLGDTGVASTGLSSLPWKHLTFTYDAVTCALKIYVTGETPVTHTIESAACGQLAGTLTLVFGEAGARFLISHLSVWDRVLTEAEVTELAAQCSSPAVGSVVSWRYLHELLLAHGPHTIQPSTCAGTDPCADDPCSGQHCIPKVEGHRCICDLGYGGIDCSEELNPCEPNQCQNGATCRANITTYVDFSCECLSGYGGPLCEESVEPGYWSPWGPPSECTKDCGGGTQKRTRTCTLPSELSDPCRGPTEIVNQCNADACGECPPFPAKAHMTFDCTETPTRAGVEKNCTVGCDPGYMFDDMPKYYIPCGPFTGFKWSVDGEINSDAGNLPSCATVDPPESVNLNTTITVGSAACSSSQAERDTVGNVVTKDLACGVCTRRIVMSGCNNEQTKRGTESVTLTISLNAGFDDSSLYVNGVYQTELADDLISNMISTMYSLADNALKLQAAAADGSLVITLGGQEYSITSNQLTIKGQVDCPPGSGVSLGVCVICGEGLYSVNGSCDKCPIGTYQHEMRQTECKMCPAGNTTHSTGSSSIAQCNVELVVTTEAPPGQTDKRNIHNLLVIILPSISVPLAIVAIIIAVVAYKKKHTNKKGDGEQYRARTPRPLTPSSIKVSPSDEASDLRYASPPPKYSYMDPPKQVTLN